jgi:hypothetical protein
MWQGNTAIVAFSLALEAISSEAKCNVLGSARWSTCILRAFLKFVTTTAAASCSYFSIIHILTGTPLHSAAESG